MKRFCLALVAFSFVASTAAAQSLAELAKQEEARRKALKTPAKVYTDADLKRLAPATPPPAPGQAPPAPATGQDTKEGEQQAAVVQAAAGEAAGEQEPQKDEAWWRNRITEARAKLERSKLLCDALQSRVNALTADFTARDDPAQRAVLANDRIKVLGELERMKAEIGAQTKAIADIEEEARQAGVPPGWLR
jgi:hypothetical protein